MRASSQATTTLHGLRSGKAGIMQTLRLMQSIVNKYKVDIEIRELAQRIVENVKQKDWFNEAKALQNWVRNTIRYTRDVSGVETIATPDHTLFTQHGDCDDQAILLASLLESIGHPTRFVAVGLVPRVYSHVYAETRINGDWLTVETTENWPIGKGPPIVKARLILDNRIKDNNIGLVKKGKNMATFKDAEEELDAELDNLILAKTLRESGYTLQDYYNGLNGMGDMSGFFKRLKKRRKKLKKKVKKIVKKVVKVAAVAAAVYFTGGAILGVAAAAKQRMAQAKLDAQRAEDENERIEAENALVMLQQAEYDQAMAVQARAEEEAQLMLAQEGIKMDTPEARTYLAKSIRLQSAKLEAGVPVGEPSALKKLAPAALIAVPVIAALALGG